MGVGMGIFIGFPWNGLRRVLANITALIIALCLILSACAAIGVMLEHFAKMGAHYLQATRPYRTVAGQVGKARAATAEQDALKKN